MRLAWTSKYEQLNEHEHEERKEGKRRDAAIVIGSLLLYALGPGLTLNPFHSREEVRHNGLVVHLGVALYEREGPHRLPLLPVQRGQGQGQQYRSFERTEECESSARKQNSEG